MAIHSSLIDPAPSALQYSTRPLSSHAGADRDRAGAIASAPPLPPPPPPPLMPHSPNGQLAPDDEPASSDVSRDVERATAASQKRKPSRAATTYPRKRATYACLTCRFRRTKCDNVQPACTSCVRLGADCRYQEADPSTFDPASLAILKRLDDLEGILQSKPTEPNPLALATSLDSTSPEVPQSDFGSSVGDLCTRGKRPLVSIEAVLQWPPFADYGFPSCLYRASQTEEGESIADLSSGRVPVDVDLPGAESSLRNFFDNVHIFNPVLEEEDVREYMKTVRFDGIGWDAVSCLVLLIYAHGSITTTFIKTTAEDSPADFRRSPAFLQAESYFLAAQKRMGVLLCRSRVIDAQCFFLAGVYLMTTLRPVEAWRMFVQALACCQGFSINPNVEGDGSEESNPKRRIYWTCFKSELELRLELNPSQKDVWDLTYPTFFPSPPEALKTKDETAWYFYLAEIALTRLKNRILSFLYRSGTSAAPADSGMEFTILDFEEQMDAWLRSLPRPLELGINGSTREQHEALRFILNGHFLDCQEVMYWQYVVDAVHGRLHGPNAELFLRKGLKVCVDRIQQNRKGFCHRHHGTWLMLRSCSRSAFVLMAAARCPELGLYLPMGWENAVMEVKKMLDLWKDESRDVSQVSAYLETLLGSMNDG